MNPRLLHYYNQELQHIREMGAEFAQEFPKIAGRLGLEGLDCADPYVERLLEGFSFLAARIQLKMDAEFPRFTQHLAELVYPQYLAPTPSMMVAQLQADHSDPSLLKGVKIERGIALRSLLGKEDVTACEYRTAHEVTLWPVQLLEAKFFTQAGDRPGGVNLPLPPGIKAGLRLRLGIEGGAVFSASTLDKLCLHIRGSDDIPVRIYEQILAHAGGILVVPTKKSSHGHQYLPKTAIQTWGFDEEQALLPNNKRTFSGYRLLQEYFAFASRFLFIQLTGLQEAVQACDEAEIDIIVLLNRLDPQLEQVVDHSYFALNCTPAINLFPHRADHIHLSDEQYELHVIPDRTRPLDLEVYQIEEVVGYGSGVDSRHVFQPFYTAKEIDSAFQPQQFYQLRREKRIVSERRRRAGQRSSYIGSEVFISLVDASSATIPTQSDLRQLGIALLCTNRDLPLSMPLGLGKTDFTLDSGVPVQSIRCVAGPSKPLPSFAEGSTAWRVLSHLSLNYLSLVDTDPEQGAQALREILMLYCAPNDSVALRQVEGLRSVQSRPITRRMPSPGPISFGRGLQIIVTFDETAFEGVGVFLLGAILDRFFAQYVSINMFTETIIKTISRGEIMRWPARSGQCMIL